MILDLIPESTRAAGLGALMKGAGAVSRVLPIPQPTLLVGAGASRRLGQAVAAFGHARVLIVTDQVIVRLGLLQGLTEALAEGGTAFAVFDEITPDAPIPLIERGIAAFREHDCDALVAVGGGSAIDAAKAIAVAIANPGRSLRALAGIGQPGRFFRQLEEMGLCARTQAFPDHHAFQPSDLALQGADALLMTEKDAVKCETFAPPETWVLPVEAQLEPDLVQWVVEKLNGSPPA